MKVVLIEFIDEFKTFIEFIDSKKLKTDDFVIVAIEPKVEAYLKSLGLSYRNTLQYFNTESHKKILVETERVMSHIRCNFTFTDSNGLKSCYENEVTHYIRLYLNHFFKVLEILKNIYREDSECGLFACTENRYSPTGLITDTERYLGSLAESFARRNNLAFTCLNGEKSSITGSQPIKRRSYFEKISVGFMLACLRNKKTIFMPRVGHVFNGLIKQLSDIDRKLVFLAIDYTGGASKMLAFNLLSFFKAFFRVRPYKYYLFNIKFSQEKASEDEWNRLSGCIGSVLGPQHEQIYVFNGISCLDLLKKKVDAGLKKHMFLMLAQSYNLNYLFQNTGTGMVLSYTSLGIMSLAGELAKRTGRISLFVSHGSHPAPVDRYHEIELLNLCRAFMLGAYSHIAIGSPVQESHLHFFKGRYDWVKNQELKTGPLIFSNIKHSGKAKFRQRLGIAPDEVVVTHATTTKARHGERYYFLETLDELFSSLSDLVEAVNALENIRLIIRIHPGFQLQDNEIRTLLPKTDKIILHRRGHFSDALAATDILVSYSSTTIDEALMSSIPVLLYDKWNRYNHFKTGVFDSPESADIFPVCYVNETRKLKGALLYMKRKVINTKKEDIDVSKYSYKSDFSSNFFSFIKDTLKIEGRGGV